MSEDFYATGVALQQGAAKRAAQRALNESYRDLQAAYDDIAHKNTIIQNLQQEIANLKLALAVAQATEEADDALLAEWKALFPQAPLRQVVAKYRDGRPKTKGIIVWENAFDAALRKRGITNPLVHRIS